MYLGQLQATSPQGGPVHLIFGPAVIVIPTKRIECSLLQLARISFGAGKVVSADGVRKVIEEDGADAYYALVFLKPFFAVGKRAGVNFIVEGKLPCTKNHIPT